MINKLDFLFLLAQQQFLMPMQIDFSVPDCRPNDDEARSNPLYRLTTIIDGV